MPIYEIADQQYNEEVGEDEVQAMLVDFVTCGDCDCQECLRNHSCPKTDTTEDPCIECHGIPPYATTVVDESNLHEFTCDEKKSSVKIPKASDVF